MRPAISDATLESLRAILDAPASRAARDAPDGALYAMHPAVALNARRAKASRLLLGAVAVVATGWIALCVYVGFAGG